MRNKEAIAIPLKFVRLIMFRLGISQIALTLILAFSFSGIFSFCVAFFSLKG